MTRLRLLLLFSSLALLTASGERNKRRTRKNHDGIEIEFLDIVNFGNDDDDCTVVNAETIQHFEEEMEMIPNQQYDFVDVRNEELNVHGIYFTLIGMIPTEMFTRDAPLIVNGERVDEYPPSCVYSKQEGNVRILASISPKDNILESIMIMNGTIPIFLQAITPCLVVETDPSHMNVEKKRRKWKLDSQDITHDHHDSILPSEIFNAIPGGRLLQQEGGECSGEWIVIGVVAAVDYSFCSALGGQINAEARVETLIAMASALFEVDGLCVAIRLVELEMNCDAETDPYREAITRNKSGCSAQQQSGGLLQEFGQIWESGTRSTVPRNAAILFTGTGLECDQENNCVIGCASFMSFCTPLAYSINFITFSNVLREQIVLVAHELGHIIGADHVGTSDGRYVMEPFIGEATLGFGDESKNSISVYLFYALLFNNCMDFSHLLSEERNPPHTIMPTNAPTPSTQSPTNGPTNAPTSSPSTTVVTNSPSESPTILPTNAPTRAPTKAPTLSPSTAVVTNSPSESPTNPPTSAPTKAPTSSPSIAVVTNSPSASPTILPTNAPTSAPTMVTLAPTSTSVTITLSPTTENPHSAVTPQLLVTNDGNCTGGNDDLIEIDIVLDNSPQQTTWMIMRQEPSTGQLDAIVSEGPYRSRRRRGRRRRRNRGRQRVNWAACRPSTFSDPLYFVIHDNFGNGICCQSGRGRFEVSVNGLVVGRGARFENRTMIEIPTVNFR